MNTLTNFETVACTIGHTDHVLTLHTRILHAEAQQPSNSFSSLFCSANPKPTAVAYRSSRVGTQPQLRTVLRERDPRIDGLDVCIYVASTDEGYGLCYYHGHALGQGTPQSAFERFCAHCAKFGVTADNWLALLRSKRI